MNLNSCIEPAAEDRIYESHKTKRTHNTNNTLTRLRVDQLQKPTHKTRIKAEKLRHA